MKKKILSILITIFALCTCMFTLTACGGDEPPAPKYYTITWQNFDGSVLETDNDVKEGLMPTYDSTTPTKESDSIIFWCRWFVSTTSGKRKHTSA